MKKLTVNKKIVSLITVMCLIITVFSFTYAADTAQGSNASTLKTINLQDVIENAMKANSEISLYDNKIKVAGDRLATANGRAEFLSVGANWGTTDTTKVQSGKDRFVYPMQRQQDLDELKWNKDNYTKNLKVDITKLYYQILVKQQEVSMQNSAIGRLNNDYEAKNKQVQLGTATTTDLLPLQVSVEQARSKLLTLQRDKYKLMMDLNNKAGYDINKQFVLKDEKLPEEEYIVQDMDKLISDLIEKSYNIKKYIKDKEIAEKEKWAEIQFAINVNNSAVDALTDKIVNSDFNVRDEKVNLEYKVRTDYNNILSLKDSITIKKLDYEKASKLKDVAKLRYDLGLIGALDKARADGDADDAWDALQQAKLDYYTAVQDFKNYINQ